VASVIVLDTSVLGLLVRSTRTTNAVICRKWLQDVTASKVTAIVPEIADYELRRELIRIGATTGLIRLDSLGVRLRYAPLTTADLRLAAHLWAQARNAGTPTADPHALDGDVILAAQARLLEPDPSQLIVATTNVRHLSRFVPADVWPNIVP
jgi:predicted nucleic acid-binding protein